MAAERYVLAAFVFVVERKGINVGDLPRIGRKVTCRDCHFLVKTRSVLMRDGQRIDETKPWMYEERAASWMIDGDTDADFYYMWGEEDGYEPECHRGEWKWENHPDSLEILDNELMTDRGECSYFFKYRKGRDVETAVDLQNKQTVVSQSKSDRKRNIVWKIITVIFSGVLSAYVSKLFGVW